MFKRVLLAYDGSPEYRRALRQGADLAVHCGAEVYLLAVVESSTALPIAGGVNPSDLVSEEHRETAEFLKQGVERLRLRGVRAEGRLGFRDPVDEIAETASDIGADLIVVGHRRRNTIERWWRRSTSKSLLAVAPCSVLVSFAPEELEDSTVAQPALAREQALVELYKGLNRQGRERLLVVARALAQDVSSDDEASLTIVSDYFNRLNESGKRRFLKVAAALSRSVGEK